MLRLILSRKIIFPATVVATVFLLIISYSIYVVSTGRSLEFV